MKHLSFLALALLAIVACEDISSSPTACHGPIDDLFLFITEDSIIDVCFTDANVGTLVYSSQSSDSLIVTARMAGSTVEVLAIAVGEAMVTVMAKNGEDLSGSIEFNVIVPNRNPESCTDLPAAVLEFFIGDTITVPFCFTDPDKHELTYTAKSSNSGAASVEIVGTEVRVTALDLDSVEVTVSAMDTEGGIDSIAFSTVIPNRAPIVCLELPASAAMYVDERRGFPVCIDDPDGQELIDSVETYPGIEAVLSAARDSIFITGVVEGESQVRYWATDPYGESAETRMELAVLVEGGGETLLLDEFNEDSGKWIPTQLLEDDPEIAGRFEIRDGSLFALFPEFGGHGGAEQEIFAESWTLTTKVRAPMIDTGIRIEILEDDGVLAYNVIMIPNKREGVYFFRFYVSDTSIKTGDPIRREWHHSMISDIPNGEWLEVEVTVRRGIGRFFINGAEHYTIRDREGVLSRISKIALEAVQWHFEENPTPVEYDHVRIEGLGNERRAR